MKDPTNPVCRTISTLLSRIGDKWTVLVVQTLAEGPKRFNELRREIPSVSQRMLTLPLRNLERDGLVSRTVAPTLPPRAQGAGSREPSRAPRQSGWFCAHRRSEGRHVLLPGRASARTKGASIR